MIQNFKLIASIVLMGLIFSGCSQLPNINSSSVNFNVKNEKFPLKIAEFSELNMSSVDNYENFKELIDNINRLTIVTEEQTDLKINTFEITQENLDIFYKEVAKFSLESMFIYGGFFYKGSYRLVGDLYFNSGFQHIALKCPSCVKFALSDLHWFIRNSFVVTVSNHLSYFFDFIDIGKEKAES